MIKIELGERLIKGTRSLDKVLMTALLDAIGDDELKKVQARATKRGVRMRPSFKRLAQQTQEELIQSTPGTAMAHGWKVRSTRKRGLLEYEVVNEDPRAKLNLLGESYTLLDVLEYGTPRPYEITGNLILKFRSGGGVVYRRRVTHPAIQFFPGVDWRGRQKQIGFIRRARLRLRKRSTEALKRLEARWKQNVLIGV
tara:strand:- start:29851 stop:30441 length:591 start_codon:yes stop_codon:yes gene_type:complete